mmetsp:Transcript_20609/g.57337  ORF Transcript_20609/g.57337 Transcript_20609/m.57337 type:complete len:986 (-) Transcript_20609:111-3068(-)
MAAAQSSAGVERNRGGIPNAACAPVAEDLVVLEEVFASISAVQRDGCEDTVGEDAPLAPHSLRIDRLGVSLSAEGCSSKGKIVLPHSAILDVSPEAAKDGSNPPRGRRDAAALHQLWLLCALPEAMACPGEAADAAATPALVDVVRLTLALRSEADFSRALSALVQHKMASLEVPALSPFPDRKPSCDAALEGDADARCRVESPAARGDFMDDRGARGAPEEASLSSTTASSATAISAAAEERAPGTTALQKVEDNGVAGPRKEWDRASAASRVEPVAEAEQTSAVVPAEGHCAKPRASSVSQSVGDSVTTLRAVALATAEAADAASGDGVFGPAYVLVVPTPASTRTGSSEGASDGQTGASVAAATSLGIDTSQRFLLCSLRVSQLGVSIDLLANPPLAASADSSLPVAWCAPWVIVHDVVVAEEPQGTQRPPDSHKYVAALMLASGCAPCMVYLAFDEEGQLERFVREVREQRRLNGTTRGPPLNRAVQVTQVAAQHAATKDEAMVAIQLGGAQVMVPAAIARLVESCKEEDAQQPAPLRLSRVWVLVQPPSFKAFQLSALCIDKLGLTLRPLVAADRLPENGRRGAIALACEGGDVEAFALMTEILHFPTSAVMDVTEDAELKASSTESAPRPATAGIGNSRSRAMPPFSRAMLPQAGVVGEAGQALSAPTPHLVAVRVKGALAGRVAHGGERVPAHMRLHAQPLPPITLYLCFAERADVHQFMSKMLAYKKYQLTLAVRAHVDSLAAISSRESMRRGRHLSEDDGPVARRMQGQVKGPSVEPPALPPRPSELPPASRLPRMVTNEEGEVFWYIPKRSGQTAGSSSGAGVTQGAVARKPDAQKTPQSSLKQPSVRVPQPLGVQGDDVDPEELSARTRGKQAAAKPPPRRPEVPNETEEPPPTSPPRQSASTSAPSARPADAASASTTSSVTGGAGGALPSSPTWLDPQSFETADIFAQSGAMDTPAPCLAAPTPWPGRPHRL